MLAVAGAVSGQTGLQDAAANGFGGNVWPSAVTWTDEGGGEDTVIRFREPAPEEYDEVLITVAVPRIGSIELPAIIFGNKVYLPVNELFDFLKIKSTQSADIDSVFGYFIHPDHKYLIDKVRGEIVFKGTAFPLAGDAVISTFSTLYLKTEYFGKVFGLDCQFDFRSLSIVIQTRHELPAIREMQQEQMRRNLHQLKGDRKADTIIRRRYPVFSIGMADWSVISTQQNRTSHDTRAELNIGASIFGGEANVLLNYKSNLDLKDTRQYYRWRYVNNDNKAIRQITAGKIFPQLTSLLYGPVTGIQVTNAPTTYRRSFGTYTLSNRTEPDWMVELYVNNVLVNYVKADASGFFTFEVPMVYGNSSIRLKFYGPFGEERTREEQIIIPFNFLPKNQFQYTATAGVVDDAAKSKFSRIQMNYGLSRRLTIGGGTEYLSTVLSGTTMPFVNASMRVAPGVMLSAEHMDGVRTRAVLNYRFFSAMQLDLNYTHYAKDQTAIKFSFTEERKAVLSFPIRSKKFNAFSRMTFSQLASQSHKYTTGEVLFSAVMKGVSSNLTTSAIIADPSNPYIYSNLSLTFRLPTGIRITPQAQFEYSLHNFSLLKLEVEKNVRNRGFLNVSYETNLQTKLSFVNVGFRFSLNFTQAAVSVRQGKNSTAVTQSARGSLIMDTRGRSIQASNQASVGKGGIVLSPFLDLNCNGVKDANERRLPRLKFRINGGSVRPNQKDSTVYIYNLEAYQHYFIEIDESGFDNVAWRIRHKTLDVVVDPNSLKMVEIPVAVGGEVSGTVELNSNGSTKGLGRVIVNVLNSEKKIVGNVMTEADGYFSLMGLAPGKYTAQLDVAQVGKLGYTALPAEREFAIEVTEDGGIADGIDFTLVDPVIKGVSKRK